MQVLVWLCTLVVLVGLGRLVWNSIQADLKERG